MKRILIGIVIGGAIVFLFNGIYDWAQNSATAARVARISTEPPENWLIIHKFDVSNSERANQPPIATIDYEIVQPVKARSTVTPRNVTTGDPVCAGGGNTATTYMEPVRDTLTIDVGSLAGLVDCQFPPGIYVVTLDIALEDAATGVVLKPLVVDSNAFEVAY